jgi:RNAse (barnase) inhibitor barstar
MKSFVIDGDNVNNLDGLYDEIERVICPEFPFGRNLDALNDAFVGGLSEKGIAYDEPAEIKWIKSDESKKQLGDEQFQEIIEIIEGHGHYLSLE